MVEATLTAMAKGGIYDHIFDGFARFDSDVEDFLATCWEGGRGEGSGCVYVVCVCVKKEIMYVVALDS